MSVTKEWECMEHGTFECSHPICPALGCDSKLVKRVFLTPPNIGSSELKRFNEGIKKSADMYGINNFRTARAGEAAYGGEAAKAASTQVLWGDDIQKTLGLNMGDLTARAQQPLTVTKPDGSKETLTRNNPMREVATELGITRRALPKAAEVTGSLKEKELNHGNPKKAP
jgi:hypothetical protein